MLILASASPRRKQLLSLITDNFTVITDETDETLPDCIEPHDAVESLALRKAQAVAFQYPQDVVIGADTVVTLEGDILGKPWDPEDAARMLSRLSGKRHQVYTGVAVLYPGGQELFHQITHVDFNRLTQEQIARYVNTGEPMDKAGAYGIQQRGALFVKGIEGDFYNVVGLPVARLSQILDHISTHMGTGGKIY